MAKTAEAAAGGAANTEQPTLASLKDEGSRAFAMKKYDEANAAWDRALALPTITPADAALLRNNKAACHMVAKRFKEAVAECSGALEAQPDYLKALVRRSKAYENMGQYKQALADLQRANKLDGASDETRAAERRVKDLAAGKGANGAARKTLASAGGPAGMGRQVVIPVKLSYENDTRAFNIQPGVSYIELLDHAKRTFPAAGHLVLKFLDKEGDWLTIASRQDIARAIQEAASNADPKRMAQGAGIPPIRMQAIKVASEAEVPKPIEEETRHIEQLLQRMSQLQAKNAPQAPQQQQQQPLVVDEWLLNLVELLKEHAGIDPERPLEAQEVGTERLNAAFQAMVADDPKADEIFNDAEARFVEMTATGMVCQGQVSEGKAALKMQKAARDGIGADKIAAEVEALLKKAEAKADEALAYCPTLVEGFLLRHNIEQERAKLAANYCLEPAQPREDLADPAERQAAEEAASKAAVLKAFERLSKEGVAKADAHMEKAIQHVRDAIEALPEKEKNKELKPLKPMAEQSTAPEDATPVKASLLINIGNSYYEHSILRAGIDGEWKPLVKKAQELFREAGAAEIDIYHALKGHPKADEMEDIIGPEPKPASAAAAAPPATEEAPKGLPTLGPRKKKDGA